MTLAASWTESVGADSRRPRSAAVRADSYAGRATSPRTGHRAEKHHDDAAVSATRFLSADPNALVAAVKQAGVKRLLVVGAAGSLEVAPGKALVDSPGFPDAFKAEATAGRAFLDVLPAEPALDWTFLSPSADFAPGQRTGKFRLGTDRLLVDGNGKSSITMKDLAIALGDELERPTHSRQRFTAGY